MVACLVLLETGSAWGASQPPPNPEELWKQFPLDPQATVPDPRPAATVPPEPAGPPTPPSPERGAETNWTLVVVAGIGGSVLLLAFAAGLLLATRRRGRGATPPISETTGELIARAYAIGKEAAKCDTLLIRQRNEGIRGMSETADHDLPVAQATSNAGSSGYAEIGERVASVLSAAETAADQIRSDARLEAEELLRAAREGAEQLRSETEAYDTDTRAAVDGYATERRREAEHEVREQLAESEGQARATREAAEQMARQIEEVGRQRGQALREESRSVEERLKKALVGLRHMAAQLEELVATPADPTDGESLADALKPYGKPAGDGQPVAASQTDER